MSILDNLQRASFRGVPFLIKGSQRQGGRKSATHDYPNTDHRFIEDLGKIVPVFQIEATIHGKDSDYIIKRDKFIDALEQKGSGQLSHPFYTNMNVMVVGYTLNETFTELGVASFSIEFGITGKSLFPAQDKDTSTLVNSKIDSAIQNVQAWLGENYTPATGNREGHLFNVDMFSRFIAAYSASVLSVGSQQNIDQDLLADLKYQQSYIQDNKHALVANADTLSEEIVDSFNALDNTDSTNFILLNSYTNFFYFQQDITLPAATTIQRVKNEQNFWAITHAVSLLALMYAYRNATEIDYFTTEDLLAVGTTLENQYQYIISLNGLDYELFRELKNIRASMVDFFDQVRQNVYNIMQVNVQQIPLSVLVYQYYGSLDVEPDLLNLNRVVDPAFIDGSFKLLVE